jgi:hypothetical protein
LKLWKLQSFLSKRISLGSLGNGKNVKNLEDSIFEKASLSRKEESVPLKD